MTACREPFCPFFLRIPETGRFHPRHRSPHELGSKLEAFAGLDFNETLKRLCLLRYGKVKHSRPWGQLSAAATVVPERNKIGGASSIHPKQIAACSRR